MRNLLAKHHGVLPALALVAWFATATWAQSARVASTRPQGSAGGVGSASSTQLPQGLEGVGIDQRLNEMVPLDIEFVDEQGAPVMLGDYFGDKPVILALVYYECPMLCTLELNGLLRTLRVVPLNVGEDFEVVTVSFDPGETPKLAADKKREYASQYGREGAEQGWHFLTGTQESISRLTEAVGFRYRYDPETDLFNHASAMVVLTPQGRLSKYFYGVEYSARDMRLGLVEASEGKIGSPVDEVLLYCFHYDPETGKYGVVIMNVLRLAGLATVLVLGLFIFVMLRRDKRRRFFVLGTRHTGG